MAATVSLKKIKQLGEDLAATRAEITALDEKYDKDVALLKEKREALSAALLESLKATGLKSIKASNGEAYTHSIREKIYFPDPYTERRYAIEHGAVIPDKRVIETLLKKEQELPEGAVKTETEYISIRSPKPEKIDTAV